jgi:hypothetical protein
MNHCCIVAEENQFNISDNTVELKILGRNRRNTGMTKPVTFKCVVYTFLQVILMLLNHRDPAGLVI